MQLFVLILSISIYGAIQYVIIYMRNDSCKMILPRKGSDTTSAQYSDKYSVCE